MAAIGDNCLLDNPNGLMVSRFSTSHGLFGLSLNEI